MSYLRDMINNYKAPIKSMKLKDPTDIIIEDDLLEI